MRRLTAALPIRTSSLQRLPPLSLQAKASLDDSTGFGPLDFVKQNLAPSVLAFYIALMPFAASAELSGPQKIVAQTWSIVDATFVDRTFNNNDWFKIRQNLIKRDYLDNDAAYKAIQEEMLKPLGDQYTRFIDPVKYAALRDSIVSIHHASH
jgi:hypothetical protein